MYLSVVNSKDHITSRENSSLYESTVVRMFKVLNENSPQFCFLMVQDKYLTDVWLIFSDKAESSDQCAKIFDIIIHFLKKLKKK